MFVRSYTKVLGTHRPIIGFINKLLIISALMNLYFNIQAGMQFVRTGHI